MSEQGDAVDHWYSVRSVFSGGWTPPGSEAAPGNRSYEERITLWRAASAAEAGRLASTEAVEYAGSILEAPSDVDLIGSPVPAEAPRAGAVVFVGRRRSEVTGDDYLDEFFDTGSEHEQPVDDAPTDENTSSGWFAVRCLFELPDAAGYEERFTLWSSDSAHEAIAAAETEAATYANSCGARYLEFAQSFQLFDDPDHGGEVFSLIRDSDLEPSAYVERFFGEGGRGG